jgi:hypothetical protein
MGMDVGINIDLDVAYFHIVDMLWQWYGNGPTKKHWLKQF